MINSKHSLLKRCTCLLVILLCLFTLQSASADVGGLCASGVDKFNHSYTLTGNGASDMVAVAEKQLNKTDNDLGYVCGPYDGWCAAFINDCAKLAGQEKAIPFVSGKTHDVVYLREYVLARGGKTVTEPKKGDLCIYYCTKCCKYVHVGLCAGNGYYIDGSLGGKVQKYSMGNQYNDTAGHSTSNEIRREYIRPNYGESTTAKGSLRVVGVLDGIEKADLAGYATFDVYVDGKAVATGRSSYTGSYTYGKKYEIRNVQPASGKIQSGTVQNGSGTFAKGEKVAVITINTIAEPTMEWQYCDVLPGTLDLDTVEVQYNNIYEKVAESSPGDDWTQGPLVSSYEKVGNPYTVLKPETTSDTLQLVKWEYFHWCKTSGENVSNYAYDTSKGYVHEDVISNTSSVTVAQSGPDGSYTWYYLKWKSSGNWAYCHGGTTCSASHGDRCYAWYKRYTYQKMRKADKWQWTKESGWQDELNPEATRVEYRFRLQHPDISWKLVLPGDLEIIGEEAFYSDEALTSVRLGPAVIEIQEAAFAYCTALKWVYIPDSVKTIAVNAFSNCEDLKFVCESGNAGVAFAEEHGIQYYIMSLED